MTVNKDSFTAADAFPAKLLNRRFIYGKQILPIHIQLAPTNRCNKKCKFCSCADRDQKAEIEWPKMRSLVNTFSKFGVTAVTITGGGEPLLYDKINDLIRLLGDNNIETGLVTNGLTFHNLDSHKNLTWCRVSCEDNQPLCEEVMDAAIHFNPGTDWAFSYVLSANPNYDNIKNTIFFANSRKMTHVRVVSDICNRNGSLSMETVKFNLRAEDTSRVIFQDRNNPVHGSRDCWISLLKPVVAPEGIFPCCGTQYAIDGEPRTMSEKMCMGTLNDIEDVFRKSIPFNGSICDNCYYSAYNNSIGQAMADIKHREFI